MADNPQRPGSQDPFYDDLGNFLEDAAPPPSVSKRPRGKAGRLPAEDDSELSLENLDEPGELNIDRAHMPGQSAPSHQAHPERASDPQPFRQARSAASPPSGVSHDQPQTRPETPSDPAGSPFRPAAESLSESLSEHREPPRQSAPRSSPGRPAQQSGPTSQYDDQDFDLVPSSAGQPAPQSGQTPSPAPEQRSPQRPGERPSTPRAAAPTPAEASEKPPQAAERPAGLRATEKAALAALAIILLTAGFVFLRAMIPDDPESPGDQAQDRIKLPVKGTLVTVSEVETFWRDRIDGDAAKPDAMFLPAVKLQTSGGSGEAYLQVLLRDPDGRIRGDAHTFRLQNGRPGTGDSPECLAVGTEGYGNPLIFMEYRGNLEKNWTVELLESKEEKAPADEWRRIAFFQLSKRYVPKDGQGS